MGGGGRVALHKAALPVRFRVGSRGESVCRARQHFTSVGGDDDCFLDADSEDSRKVDARFDREDHPLLQEGLGSGVHPRQFVNLKTQAVTESMSKTITEASLRETVAGHRVHLAGSHAGPDGIQRFALGFHHNVQDPGRGKAFREVHTGVVTVVPLDDSAEVHEQG